MSLSKQNLSDAMAKIRANQFQKTKNIVEHLHLSRKHLNDLLNRKQDPKITGRKKT